MVEGEVTWRWCWCCHSCGPHKTVAQGWEDAGGHGRPDWPCLTSPGLQPRPSPHISAWDGGEPVLWRSEENNTNRRRNIWCLMIFHICTGRQLFVFCPIYSFPFAFYNCVTVWHHTAHTANTGDTWCLLTGGGRVLIYICWVSSQLFHYSSHPGADNTRN